MRREVPEPRVLPEPPKHLRRLDPTRYQMVAELSLRDHPRDAWTAAYMMWRVWQHECQVWQAEHGLVWGMEGWRTQLGPGRPPLAWVREVFGVPLASLDTVCPEDCRTHRLYRQMRESLPGRRRHGKVLPRLR